MSVAVRKVNGVEKVEVSLNRGNASIRFKPESTAQYEDVRSAVEKNGFSVREARIKARGRLQKTEGRVQFVVSGSGEIFNVSSADLGVAQSARDLDQPLGQELVLDGAIPSPEKNKRQDKLLVNSISSANPK